MPATWCPTFRFSRNPGIHGGAGPHLLRYWESWVNLSLRMFSRFRLDKLWEIRAYLCFRSSGFTNVGEIRAWRCSRNLSYIPTAITHSAQRKRLWITGGVSAYIYIYIYVCVYICIYIYIHTPNDTAYCYRRSTKASCRLATDKQVHQTLQ